MHEAEIEGHAKYLKKFMEKNGNLNLILLESEIRCMGVLVNKLFFQNATL